ncbi:nucleoside triphosphate pyrophosphatase [Legionella sp. km772]|uniref:Maf family protein n=1 Tax=Legionella sp. km772 TaxID=2498111 RepID=UPI000F8E8A45|nr:nucleoside triphosphate pyrophosphatase [Legionella sp. km772]RUR10559.1 septum formation protein Maf [Legionella sp. km772]
MSNFLHQEPLILASGSKIRSQLLETLGLAFSVVPAHCDEDVIKKAHPSNNILDLGFALARSKALTVSAAHRQKFIIAADQLCVIDDKILDKPITHKKAVEHLHLLNGRKHQQIVCLCIAHNNKIIWQHHDKAYLTVRDLSDEFIEHYLREEQPYDSCGAYHFETQGNWLFKQIEGNTETILGLPLIPLMNAFLELGIVKI